MTTFEERLASLPGGPLRIDDVDGEGRITVAAACLLLGISGAVLGQMGRDGHVALVRTDDGQMWVHPAEVDAVAPLIEHYRESEPEHIDVALPGPLVDDIDRVAAAEGVDRATAIWRLLRRALRG